MSEASERASAELFASGLLAEWVDQFPLDYERVHVIVTTAYLKGLREGLIDAIERLEANAL